MWKCIGRAQTTAGECEKRFGFCCCADDLKNPGLSSDSRRLLRKKYGLWRGLERRSGKAAGGLGRYSALWKVTAGDVCLTM